MLFSCFVSGFGEARKLKHQLENVKNATASSQHRKKYKKEKVSSYFTFMERSTISFRGTEKGMID